MTDIWLNKVITWKDPKTWVPLLSAWLEPFFDPDGPDIQSLGYQDLYIDDPEWLDIFQNHMTEPLDYIIDQLSEAISVAKVTAYHGCRAENAMTYHENGIMQNDPYRIADEVRKIVSEENDLSFMRDKLELELSQTELWDRDTGKVYLTADDRSLIDYCGHYLIYGSEWILSFLGFAAHRVLRNRGVPTIVIAEMPLSEEHNSTLVQFAKKLLHEWTRINVNKPTAVWSIDFSFVLNRSVPPEWIISHYHPDGIPDPLHQRIKRHGINRACPACAQEV